MGTKRSFWVCAGQGAVEQQGVIDGQQGVVDVGPGAAVVGGVLPGAVGIVDGGDGNGLDGRTVGIGNRAVDHDGGHTVTGGGEIVFVDGGQARVVIGQHGGIVDGIDGDGCGVGGRGKGGGGRGIRVGAGAACALIPGLKGKCGRAVVIGCGHETQLLGVAPVRVPSSSRA